MFYLQSWIIETAVKSAADSFEIWIWPYYNLDNRNIVASMKKLKKILLFA